MLEDATVKAMENLLNPMLIPTPNPRTSHHLDHITSLKNKTTNNKSPTNISATTTSSFKY